MLRIEQHLIDSIGLEKYKEYFVAVFGEREFQAHAPSHIIILLDDYTPVGFASWYVHNAYTILLQCIGFIGIDELRKHNDWKTRKYVYFNEVISFLLNLEKGVGIIGNVYNDNYKAIDMFNRCGFKIIGGRCVDNWKYVIEIAKDGING